MSLVTHKFKIDQIVVVGPGLPHSGKRGTIFAISKHSSCYQVFVNDGGYGWYAENELEGATPTALTPDILFSKFQMSW